MPKPWWKKQAGPTEVRIAILALFLFIAILLFTNRPPPNVILITADSLRPDYLGAYGFKGNISQSIDRLAGQSVVFERGFTQAPSSVLSLTTLFTSQYPTNQKKMTGDHASLAEVFKENGYNTGAFIGNPLLTSDLGFQRGFDTYGQTPEQLLYAGNVFFPALEWLEFIGKKKPFFIYLHFTDTRFPYQCAEDDIHVLEKFPKFEKSPSLSSSDRRAMPSELKSFIKKWPTEFKSNSKYFRACYGAGVNKFDQRLSGFLKRLKSKGFLKNTILVFVGNHGEELYDDGGWLHGRNLYNHQLHVPFFVRFPKGRHAGKRVAHPVGLIDVAPTVLKLAKLRPSKSMQGQNLIPLIKGRSNNNGVISMGLDNNPNLFAIQNAAYKLIYDRRTKESQVFNLAKDPLEKIDISEKEAGKDLAKQLEDFFIGDGADETIPAKE